MSVTAGVLQQTVIAFVSLCFCVMWLDVFALVDHSHYTLQDSGFKVKTYPEIKMMSLFTHRQVFPNLFFLYNLSSIEDKWRKNEECPGLSLS